MSVASPAPTESEIVYPERDNRMCSSLAERLRALGVDPDKE
jgi:hypothetical protein